MPSASERPAANSYQRSLERAARWFAGAWVITSLIAAVGWTLAVLTWVGQL